MRVVHTLASTQAQRARISPSCGGSGSRPTTDNSVFTDLFPSRFHLPVPLRSIPVTGLPRYYEDSDAFRVRLFGPPAAMNSASLPRSRSPLHLTPTSNHPVSNHPRAPPPAPFAVDAGGSACLCSLPLMAKAQVLGLRLSLADSPNSETESSLTW